MKKYIAITFIFFFFSSISGLNAQVIDTLQKVNYYKNKVAKYLDKKGELSSHYNVNTKGIGIYSSAQNKLNNKPELFVNWDEIEAFKAAVKTMNTNEIVKLYGANKLKTVVSKNNTSHSNKLKGMKIAIDPGHTAGDMEGGKMESKCLDFVCADKSGTACKIAISEGVLTFATATLLKEKLEAQGAQVFMTRTFMGGTAYGKTFDDWLKKENIDSLHKAGEISQKQKDYLLNSKISKKEKFHAVFKNLDLKKRGEIINDYHPDMTIVIHFNVDEKNTGWNKPGDKNFNMIFIGGAFMPSDLSSFEKRFEFLRLLVTDDIENSIELGSSVVKNFEKNLNVKTAKQSDATYLMKGCLPTQENGVYCRNLQLTRYIHGTVVYGETLYQDNINECILLNQETDKTKNQRIQQVAEAYFQGIQEYVNKKQNVTGNN